MSPHSRCSPGGPPFARLLAENRRASAQLGPFERAACGTGPAARRRGALATFARYLEGPFAEHLDLEEREVFPVLASAVPELSIPLGALRENHDELRGMGRSLRELLALPADERRAERCFVLGRDLTDLLRLHLRIERAVLQRGREWSAGPAAPAGRRPAPGRRSRT